ncbi:MAG: aminopeptidase P family protein [Chloroflexi bacterium]|nr:aminopeptidase P family protein [Chloroflexota bacterium]MBV9600070.1 aminopeptidase P family protein [Chloroflexota bacterium]
MTDLLLPRANAGDPASGGPVDYPHFSDAERNRRWSLVRELMRRDGIDLIVGFPNSHMFDSYQASTRYLTGIGGNCASVGVIFPESGEVTATVSPDQHPDYLHAVQDWVADIRPVSSGWAYAPPYLDRLREVGVANARIGVIGLSGNTRYAEGSASYGLITAIQQAFPHAEIVNATFLLDEARYVKSDEELVFIQKATELAERALEVLRAEAQPGVTERALIGRMLGRMVEDGGDLPTMILWSAGWPQPPTNHYQPTGRPLRAGDMFATELEARWAGYVGQRTQMGFIQAAIPPLYQQLADVQKLALERCYELLRPGFTVGELVSACNDITVDTPFTCRILMHGKGIGDDAPIAIYGARDERMSKWPIENNACFIIKPMVMKGEKEQFVYWGDTVVATPDGARRLGSQAIGLLQID